jgi:hypothetical protein
VKVSCGTVRALLASCANRAGVVIASSAGRTGCGAGTGLAASAGIGTGAAVRATGTGREVTNIRTKVSQTPVLPPYLFSHFQLIRVSKKTILYRVERRRARWFDLQLPVSITRNGTEPIKQSGLTKQISSCGVLFTAEREADIGASIEYVITLGVPLEQSISLSCIGKVLRANRSDGAQTYDIAATLERYEFIREYLPRARYTSA